MIDPVLAALLVACGIASLSVALTLILLRLNPAPAPESWPARLIADTVAMEAAILRVSESITQAGHAFFRMGISAQEATAAMQRLGELLPPIPERRGPFSDLRVAWLAYREAVLDTGPGRALVRASDWVAAEAWRRFALRVLILLVLALMLVGPYLLK